MPAATQRQPGRPSKFTEEARRVILEAVSGGCTREVAAAAAGIGTSTLYGWLEQGEADVRRGQTSEYREFAEAIKQADAAAETTAIAAIRFAGQTQWQALAWWLERRHPDRWAKRVVADQQIEQIKAETRQAQLGELTEEISKLPTDVQRLLFGAMERAATLELTRDTA